MQHKEERWRGVILGWERVSNDSTTTSSGLTSLTSKDYKLLLQDDEEVEETSDQSPVQYTMILDSGDAHFLGGRRTMGEQSGYPVAFQHELELVTDTR